MRKVTFLENTGLQKINVYEKNYWKKIMKQNIKIGVEIESCMGGNYRACIEELKQKFQPTNDVSRFGKSGVCEVKTDGSLRNGIELTTVGRKVNFLEMYQQYKSIVDVMMDYNPDMNSRAGLHNHVLFDYGSYHDNNEIQFNELVFKNFMQLIKRHFPELVWLTSTVKPIDSVTEDNVITRDSNFCEHGTLFRTSINRPVGEYKDIVLDGVRYKAVNFNRLRIINNKIERFHIELRFPDGSIYPAQIAAQNVLYLAMLLKAVDLSEVGLISTGDDWEETKTLTIKIRNNEGNHDGDDRCSNNGLEDSDVELIKNRAKEFIQFLKNNINTIEPKAYSILMCLAEKPISLMRREMSDLAINEYFDSIIKTSFKDNTNEDILKLIAAQEITGCNSKENWCYKAAQITGMQYKDVDSTIKLMSTLRNLRFDYETGQIIEE